MSVGVSKLAKYKGSLIAVSAVLDGVTQQVLEDLPSHVQVRGHPKIGVHVVFHGYMPFLNFGLHPFQQGRQYIVPHSDLRAIWIQMALFYSG